jgi:hypothetical protein
MQIGGDLVFGFFYSDQRRGIKARQKLFRTSFLRKTGDLQMIQEMSLDLFGERLAVFVSSPGAEEAKLAKALTQDAARHAGEAGKQRKYAGMARALIRETANDESRRELIRIAVWHYERCAAGFRQAVVSFESAAKIQKATGARRKWLKKAETAADSKEAAMRAEFAAGELKTSVKMKKGGLKNETG